MSSEFAVSVNELSKCYKVYERPEHRLWQMVSRSEKKWFKEFWALQDVSFNIQRGETLAVIGRNGSGKSTLLQMICGTLEPTAGKIQVDGKIAALLELGAGFNPDFSGRENVYLNSSILGMKKLEIDANLRSIIEFADIGDFLDQPVKTYSSGMYVRLAFSVAIHCQPEVLIVDEALAVGDFLFQQKCSRFMKQQFSDVTKLLVTHDMAAVANMADRAIVLHQGNLVFHGDPQSAIREYQIVARSHDRDARRIVQEHTTTLSGQEQKSLDDDSEKGWVALSEQNLSGTLRAKILKYSYNVDNIENAGAIKSSEKLKIDFETFAEEDLDTAIIGYQVQDRFGSVVFGENSMTSRISIAPINKGLSRFSISITWPVLAPGKYAITLGIGTGYDALTHEIECWAHNMFVLDSTSDVVVHGVFNVTIDEISMRKVSS